MLLLPTSERQLSDFDAQRQHALVDPVLGACGIHAGPYRLRRNR
jgi:hypothetical protein